MSDNKTVQPKPLPLAKIKPKPSLRLRFETVGSIAAIVVGVAALFMSWYQARVMQAQQHAAVWPILTIDQGTSIVGQEFVFEFSIANAGVGPAILHYAKIENGGKVLNSWSDVTALRPDTIPVHTRSFGSSIRGRALAAGGRFSPKGYAWAELENWGNLSRQLEATYMNTSLSVCYCSVFDKCWMVSSASDAPATPVGVCPQQQTELP